MVPGYTDIAVSSDDFSPIYPSRFKSSFVSDLTLLNHLLMHTVKIFVKAAL